MAKPTGLRFGRLCVSSEAQPVGYGAIGAAMGEGALMTPNPPYAAGATRRMHGFGGGYNRGALLGDCIFNSRRLLPQLSGAGAGRMPCVFEWGRGSGRLALDAWLESA